MTKPKKIVKTLDHERAYCIMAIRKCTIDLLKHDMDAFHNIACIQIIDKHLDHLK